MPMAIRRKPKILVIAAIPPWRRKQHAEADEADDQPPGYSEARHRDAEEIDDPGAEQKEGDEDREGVNAGEQRLAVAPLVVEARGQRDEQGRGAERVHDRQQRADGEHDRLAEDRDRLSPARMPG